MPGYYVEEGKPYRACDLTGTFTAIVNPCLRTCTLARLRWWRAGAAEPTAPFCRRGRGARWPPSAIQCAKVTEGNAEWPATDVDTEVVEGECLVGYNGTAERACLDGTTAPGVWGPIITACERMWPDRGRPAYGMACQRLTRRVCPRGRPVLHTAIYCRAVNDDSTPGIFASFGQTLAGTVAVGTCNASMFGLPQRRCLPDGTWEDAILRNPCTGAAHSLACTGIRGQLQRWCSLGSARLFSRDLHP